MKHMLHIHYWGKDLQGQFRVSQPINNIIKRPVHIKMEGNHYKLNKVFKRMENNMIFVIIANNLKILIYLSLANILPKIIKMNQAASMELNMNR